MGTSFEFLAAFGEWEERSRLDPEHMELPGELPDTEDGRLACAELLTLLTAYGEKAGNAAKNSMFPRLIDDKSCGTGMDWNAWKSWMLPTPESLRFLPDGSCLLNVDVKLQRPFFSRDDRAFYPTENVLRRHHVFRTPFLAASGLKGLLRWAWNMSGGSGEDADLLFGRAAEEDGESRQGLLYLWPVYWQGRTGMEVINPQSRTEGVGTGPVKYEVLKPGRPGNGSSDGMGSIFLLLLNEQNVVPRLLPRLVDALFWLFDCGGLSARSSVGWGQVSFSCGRVCIKGRPSQTSQKKQSDVARDGSGLDEAEAWREITGGSDVLPEYPHAVYTKARCLAVLHITTGMKLKNRQKDKKAFMEDLRRSFEAWRKGERTQVPEQPLPEQPSVPGPEEKLTWQSILQQRQSFEEKVNAMAKEMDAWRK